MVMYWENDGYDWENLFYRSLEYRDVYKNLSEYLLTMATQMSQLFAYRKMNEVQLGDIVELNPYQLNILQGLHDINAPEWSTEATEPSQKRLAELVSRVSTNWINHERTHVSDALIAYEEMLDYALFEIKMADLNPRARKEIDLFGDPVFHRVPNEPPEEFAERLGVGYHWKRQAMVLRILAECGFSIRHEILSYLGTELDIDPTSGSLKDLIEKTLKKNNFVESALLDVNIANSRTRLRVVRLKDDGRKLCEKLGWEPIESDWERLIRLHNGLKQKQHTAAVLTFAYQARLRGWEVQVLPEFEDKRFEPDVLVKCGGKKVLVEVELGLNKTKKWQRLSEEQGYVGICAPTKKRRERLVRECLALKIHGIVTDLETLIRDPDQRYSLWADRFVTPLF